MRLGLKGTPPPPPLPSRNKALREGRREGERRKKNGAWKRTKKKSKERSEDDEAESKRSRANHQRRDRNGRRRGLIQPLPLCLARILEACKNGPAFSLRCSLGAQFRMRITNSRSLAIILAVVGVRLRSRQSVKEDVCREPSFFLLASYFAGARTFNLKRKKRRNEHERCSSGPSKFN